MGFLALSGGACSSGGPSTSSSGGATGSSGGTSGGSGGASASGGTTGSGGSTASGGTTASGGASASGGATASGGASASGGTTASGGASASGGATASGGASASGGATGTAGAAGGSGGGAGGATTNGGSTGGGGRASGGDGRMGGGAGRMGGGGRDGSGAGGSAIPATMTLTSPVLMEGGMFPAGITCADAAMGSPELDWTPGPAGTMSYAVVMTDLTQNIFHWAIWNIPVPSGDPSTISLKGNLAKTAMLSDPAGARQTSLMGSGYFGPCPNGTEHTYQFQVYAIPSTMLSGNTNSVMNVRDAARAVATATGSLSGKSSAKRP